MQSPQLDIQQFLKTMPRKTWQLMSISMSARSQDNLFLLEAFVVHNCRHHQANVLLMTGIWVRYLDFTNATIFAHSSAPFILGKLREPYSSAEGEMQGVGKFSILSASPGIVLAVLGVLLMFTTMIRQKDV